MSFTKIIYAKWYEDVAVVSYKDQLIEEWCREHCKKRWFRKLKWAEGKFVEFEDEQEAAFFALRWL